MKKLKFIAIGILVTVVIIISPLASKNKVYEKTMKHTNPIDAIEDYIGYGNVKVVSETNKTYTPEEFFESISRRYRLSVGDDRNAEFIPPRQSPSFTKYEIEEVTGSEFEALKKEHLESYSYIPNYKRPEEIYVYKLTGEFTDGYILEDKSLVKEDGSIVIDNEMKGYLQDGGYYFIVVDEGEGYVVDYCRNLRDNRNYY